MSTSATTNFSVLQEDMPAKNLPELQHSLEIVEQQSKATKPHSTFKKIIDTQPFFRYGNDGLYGLL
ncbi:MAG: hypothetical protein EOO42_08485 [Flavobacteriales bacterium]|nr:MAG: hypothetical protein EOO42_08485 [Flavobacteriales bacterium]